MWQTLILGEGHSEVGKVEMGAYLRGKDDSCMNKDYTSPLTSPPNLKNQARWPSGDHA